MTMRIMSLLYMCFMHLDSKVMSLSAPKNLSVESKNFDTLLHWSPGKYTPLGTVYSVQIDKHMLETTETNINISEYIKLIFFSYTVELWASNNGESSPKKNITVSPFEIIAIGPPSFNVSGCGDCLNISISLPKPKYILDTEYNSFYSNVHFNIHWRKAEGEQSGCNNSVSKYYKIQVQSYTYVLQHLQKGERYCVQVQLQSTSKNIQTSCWICEFTSVKEPRGVMFLAGWLGIFVSSGLSLLILTICVIYTGFLCKPKRRTPKALFQVSPVPIYDHDLEKVCLSVAYIECSLKQNKAKGHLQNLCGDNNIEENEEEEESHHGYMEHSSNDRDENTETGNYNIFAENVKIYETHSFQDLQAPTESPNLNALSNFHNSLDKYEKNRIVTWNRNINPPESKREEKVVEQTKENNDGFKNIKLWSVTLNSMQHEDEQRGEMDESRKPLLSSLFKELHNEALASTSQTEGSAFTDLPTNLQAELQFRPDEQTDISQTDSRDHTQTGYMATHTGIIETKNESSEDEDVNNSCYLTR